MEGISPETVQTSLGRDVGHLNLTGARVNAKALQRLGLELLDSVLSVEAEVPWRHLFTQPTKLTVRTLQLELRLRPNGPLVMPPPAWRAKERAGAKC